MKTAEETRESISESSICHRKPPEFARVILLFCGCDNHWVCEPVIATLNGVFMKEP